MRGRHYVSVRADHLALGERKACFVGFMVGVALSANLVLALGLKRPIDHCEQHPEAMICAYFPDGVGPS